MILMVGEFKCPACGRRFWGKVTSDYYCTGGDWGMGQAHPPAAIVFVRGPQPKAPTGQAQKSTSKQVDLPGPYWRT